MCSQRKQCALIKKKSLLIGAFFSQLDNYERKRYSRSDPVVICDNIKLRQNLVFKGKMRWKALKKNVLKCEKMQKRCTKNVLS